jgi:uncharacterized membrane protein YfcA
VNLAAFSVLAIAGVWVLYTFPPATSAFYPRCVFRELSGLDCPGCGTTRALHALLHGRIGEAFRFNAMLFPLMIVALAGAPSFLRGRVPAFMMHKWFGWSSFVVIVAWWIGRNVVDNPW